MDPDDITLEEKCENLMNVVVESRKRFGKMCHEYEQKSLVMENKMLNLQLEALSNYKFKPKNPIPNIDEDSMKKETENFATDIKEQHRRTEDLMRNIKNLQRIVLQLNEDRIGRKLREPLTVEAMLAIAKSNKY